MSGVDDAEETSGAVLGERDGVDDDVTGKVVILTGASRGIGRGLALHLARRGARPGGDRPQAGALEEIGAELDAWGASTSTALERGRPRRLLAWRRHAGRLRAHRRAGRQRPDLPVGHPARGGHRVRHGPLLDTGPKGTLGRCRRCSRTCATRAGAASSPWARTGRSSGPPATAPYVVVQGGDPGPHAGGGTGVGQPRHHRELRVPGVGGPPDPARAGPGAGGDVREATYAAQPISRDGDAEDDIGPIVTFLLSDACRYMTGQTLMADGGAIMLH